jgi:hypothetical protein
MRRKATNPFWRAALGTALLLIAVVGLGSTRQAEAAVYWGAGSSLGRANLDGSLPLWPLPNGWFPALEAGSSCGLAVDAGHLYWANSFGGTIGRATLDGTSPDQAFVAGLGTPCGVAVDGAHLYWADMGANTIGRANLDGSDVEPGFIAGAARPCGIALDDAHVYWANQDGESIGRASLDGGEVDQSFIVGPQLPCGVAVGAGHVYWGDQGTGAIGRSDLAGIGVEPLFIPGAGEPWGVGVNATHVYWANRGTSVDREGGIGRARLDGGEANGRFIAGIHSPTGVALDTRILQPPPPQPSTYLRFGKLRRDKRRGTLTLDLHVPARGELTVNAPKIGWSVDKGNPPPWVGGVFRWKLKLWPGNEGPVAKRIRRQLKDGKRAPINLRLSYAEAGKLPLEAKKRIAFVRRSVPGRR